MNYLCLSKVFQLRQISRVFKGFVEYHLRQYFRTGPEIIAWYSAYDFNRKLLHSFPLSLEKILKTDYTFYACKHANTEDVLYDQLYFVFPKQGQTTVVELNVSRVWLTLKLVRTFSSESNFRFQPHKPNGEKTKCPNASEQGDCPAQCFRLGGIQVEFLEDLKLSHTECSSSDPRSLLVFKISEVDIEAQVLSANPRIFNQVQITREPESPLVPYDIEIAGARFKLDDYKRILPQNPYLLEWYDRIIIGE
jgi:hypothetical protein